jgi:hypothetical protein
MSKGTNRHSDETIRKVIKEIRLRFTTGKYHSKLQEVVIVPLVGSPEELRLDCLGTRTTKAQLFRELLTEVLCVA